MSGNRLFTKDCRGSFTIEAAVIVSFLVFLMQAIILFSFFLYNRCSMERAAAMGALRGSQEIWQDNSFRYQKTEEGINNILSYNLLGQALTEKEIEVKGNLVRVKLRLQSRFGELETEAEKKAVNPVIFIRNYRKLKQIGEEAP